jgi:threonine/homoserine/homoserine lactone efflux protein
VAPGWAAWSTSSSAAWASLPFCSQARYPTEGNVALQFVVLGFVSVALNTFADVIIAFAASGIREGAAARPALICRLREASGTAMIALGVGLALVKRPTAYFLA